MTNIRLVTFDLDDTLWEIAPVIRSAEVILRDWLTQNTRLSDFPVDAPAAIRRMLIEAEPSLTHRISELRRRILFHALHDTGYSQAEAGELGEQAFQVYLEARHAVQLFPDVVPTLEHLANHYTLGVLTNGNADVRRLGLADYFQFTLCAEELGVGKPDPQPFCEALRRANVSAAQAVHIGDHPGDDIGGAQRAGMRAVWFNPAGLEWDHEGAPDAQVRSLRELPALLAGWR